MNHDRITFGKINFIVRSIKKENSVFKMPNVSQATIQLIGFLKSLFCFFLLVAMCLEAYSISDTSEWWSDGLYNHDITTFSAWCNDRLSVSDCTSEGIMICVIIALVFQGIAFLFIFFTFCNRPTQTCIWMHRAALVPMFSFGVVLGSCILAAITIGEILISNKVTQSWFQGIKRILLG